MNGDKYYCRKKNFAFNLIMFCGYKKRIMFIAVRYGRFTTQEYIGIQTAFKIVLRDYLKIVGLLVIMLCEDLGTLRYPTDL